MDRETDRETEWARSLAQAAGFVRTGATSEAVARALAVHEAAGAALKEGSQTPAERAVSQTYFDRSAFELGRYRALHASANTSAAARHEAYRSRERREMDRSSPIGGRS